MDHDAFTERAPSLGFLRWSWLLIGLAAGLLATGAVAGSPPETTAEATTLLRKVEATYSEAETLRARFEVHSINEAIGDVEVERGVLFTSRPNRMKWQYEDPEKKLVLLDGKYQWLYLPSEEQVFRGEQTETASELTLTFLADPGALEQRFHVELDRNSDDMDLARLRLDPREPKEDVQFIVLVVDKDSGIVVSMEVVDSFDNVTRIHFSDIQLNTKISGKTYRFKPPKGVELLDFQGEPIDE